MSYYDNSKDERERISSEITWLVKKDYETGSMENIVRYSSDSDTYIRKIVYLATGRVYYDNEALREPILCVISKLLANDNERIRQTAVYVIGEIGKTDAPKITGLLEQAMLDTHHSVVNAMIGALKQMGEKNPKPTLEFVRKFLKHPDPKVRREMIHGIELRGRTHPEEVLPILEEMQYDPNKKIQDMVVHVVGQISYKKGCLEKVIPALKEWENQELVKLAVVEILKIHVSYAKFSARTYGEAKGYIEEYFSIINE